jgi:hypothetical protein
MAKYVFSFRRISKLQNQGLIKLIPKDLTRDNINTWHPITWLNVSYKILVKVLTMRLKQVANQIALPKKTCFIHGIYILDTILTMWEC